MTCTSWQHAPMNVSRHLSASSCGVYYFPLSKSYNRLTFHYQDKTPPVTKMPLEIMEEIFLHCLPNEPHVRPNLAKAPLLLTNICSSWRSTALSYPKLWSTLAISLSTDNAARRSTLLKLWLERSSHHPIALFAYVPSACKLGFQAFLQTLESNLHKFKYLRLTLPYRSRLEVFDVLNRGTPALESLDIRFAFATPEDSIPENFDSLVVSSTTSPRLRSLTWNSPGPNRVTFTPLMAPLTHLDVGHCTSLPDCISILAECPMLIECHFKHICEPPTPYPIDPSLLAPISLVHLQSLSIQSIQPLGELFEILTLPALHTFKVSDVGAEVGNPIWSQLDFVALVERSQCSIQVLHLLSVLLTDTELIQCLEVTSSSLSELRLLNYKGVAVFTDRVLQRLTVGYNDCEFSEDICPNLEVIICGRSIQSTDGVFADMVESRRRSSTSKKPVVRLRSITPKFTAIWEHMKDVGRLNELASDGLEIL